MRCRATLAAALVLASGGCSTLPKTLATAAVVGAVANGLGGGALAPSDTRGRGFAVGAVTGAIGLTAIVWGIVLATNTTFAADEQPREHPPEPPPMGPPAVGAHPVPSSAIGFTFTGRPGWLIIGTTLASHAEALRVSHSVNGRVVQTGLFNELAADKFLVVLVAHADEIPASDGVRHLTLRGSLPALVRVTGRVAGSGTQVLHIKTVDDEFDTEPVGGFYEFWVGHPGPVTITISASAKDVAAQDASDCFLGKPLTGQLVLPPGASGEYQIDHPLDQCPP